YTLLGSVTVNEGVKLTILPGAYLEFPRYNCSIIVNGILDAQGTASDSIRFKGRAAPSYSSNSSHGGAIYFNKDSSLLKYVSLDSMGDNYYNVGAIVIADNIVPGITNTSIKHSEGTDIYTWAGGAKNI